MRIKRNGKALKAAGAKNCISLLFGNYPILFYKCEDIHGSFSQLGVIEDNNRWQRHIASWFVNNPKFGGSDKVQSLKKIFDLNEQLNEF